MYPAKASPRSKVNVTLFLGFGGREEQRVHQKLQKAEVGPFFTAGQNLINTVSRGVGLLALLLHPLAPARSPFVVENVCSK